MPSEQLVDGDGQIRETPGVWQCPACAFVWDVRLVVFASCWPAWPWERLTMMRCGVCGWFEFDFADRVAGYCSGLPIGR